MAAKKKTKPAKKTSKAAKAAPKTKTKTKAATKKTAPAAKRRALAKAPKKTAVTKGASKPSARRDRPGHIAPKYGRHLLAKSGGKDRDEPLGGFLKGTRSKDDLAQQLGEEVIEEATSGENEGEDILDQEVPEERGGPFVITTAQQEFGYEPDASNPKRSRREPFPRT